MSARLAPSSRDLTRRLAEAEATVQALVSGQIDAVFDHSSKTPLLLAKAQEALIEGEARYRRIVETSHEGIWTTDPAGVLTFVNGRLAEMLGYRVDEMLGASLTKFLPETLEAKEAHKSSTIRSRQGISEESEIKLVRSDKAVLWTLVNKSPIRDPKGNFAGTLAMVTDRTRHKEDEAALRKSEEQYRQIVEATTDGIIKLDSDSRITFVNRRFAEMLGYERRELIGTNLFALSSASVSSSEPRLWARRLLGAAEAVNTTFLHKNGAEISVNFAGSLLVDGQGQHIGNMAMVRDVTEQKKLQEQLMVSDRMASVGTLAAGVAHEINNPLAAVIANLDYISESLVAVADTAANLSRGEEWLRKEIKAPLEDASEAAQRVRLIVRDLKIFSRSPSQELKGPVYVTTVMESSLRMAWNEIRHRARLIRDYQPVPVVEVNEARLGQVFLNLIVNAAQALQEGRTEQNEIRVSTRAAGERVFIEVSDTGSGIPPEIVGRIFDAFFTTKQVGVGTGLGLAICQRIVADMDGELTVTSEVGKGTMFRVALPVATKIQAAPAAPAVSHPIAIHRGRILVVDDEELVARGVKRILSHEHEVVTLIAAKEALARCAGGEEFDLILCDLMMPDMTGMDLHRELALVVPAQADRMIFMTGGAFTISAQQFLAAHPRYIEKPLNVRAFRTVINDFMNNLPGPRTPEAGGGDGVRTG